MLMNNMRDIKRIHLIMQELEKLWMQERNQDMRLGQLLENFVFPQVVVKRVSLKDNNTIGSAFQTAYTWSQEDDFTLKLLKARNNPLIKLLGDKDWLPKQKEL